jgi:hypothetical protein
MPRRRIMPPRRRSRASPAATQRSSERAPPGAIRDLYRFTRTWLNATVAMTANTAVLGAINLNSNIPSNLNTFLQSFDLMKIDHVKVRFIPRFSVNTSPSVGLDDQLPQIAIVPNYDDSVAPPSVDNVLGQGQAVLRRFDREQSITVYPSMLMAAATASGSATVLLHVRDSWINASAFAFTTSVPLCKFAVTAVSGVPAAGLFDIYMEAHFILAQHISG